MSMLEWMMTAGKFSPTVREVDGAKVHDPRFARVETWSNLGFAMWFLGWGVFEVISGNWPGWIMLGLAVAFAWLGVWTIIWQWRSDVELARLDGEALLLARLNDFPKHPLT